MRYTQKVPSHSTLHIKITLRRPKTDHIKPVPVYAGIFRRTTNNSIRTKLYRAESTSLSL